VLAIIALLAATAGWTTVGVLVLTDEPAIAEPTDDLGATGSEEPVPSLEPIADSHEIPALEALLPHELNGRPLSSQSWSGDEVLAEDEWSATVRAFLTSVGKIPTDLGFAQAYDPADDGLDVTVGVFALDGVDPAGLRDAIIDAWRGDYAELEVSTITLGGAEVTKGNFGAGEINSYWLIGDGRVYDIGSADESLAAAAIAALPPSSGASAPPGASGSPGASAGPGSSTAPSASPS
jgi:hypothetical protein